MHSKKKKITFCDKIAANKVVFNGFKLTTKNTEIILSWNNKSCAIFLAHINTHIAFYIYQK